MQNKIAEITYRAIGLDGLHTVAHQIRNLDFDKGYENMRELLPEHLANVKGVGIVVLIDGKVLLGRRTDSGDWGLAGGSIDEGETPKQAAIRELYEEFGIVSFDLTYYGVSFSPANPHKAKDSSDGCSVDFFIEYERISDIPIRLSTREMSEFKWVALNEVLDEELYPSSRSSLETFLRK
jgi:8-oxo-dGTP pyrophosphatase MutT (NUDIX family)